MQGFMRADDLIVCCAVGFSSMHIPLLLAICSLGTFLSLAICNRQPVGRHIFEMEDFKI